MLPVQVETSSSIRLVDPLETPDWDKHVGQWPEATLFHTASWARVLAETYQFKPAYFVDQEGARLHAILPMFEVKSWLTGRRGVSLPFTDECQPLCSDDASFQKLFAAARQHGIKSAWKYIECRGGKAFLADATASTHFLNHRLVLQPDPKALFQRYSDSTRRAIRKAEKSGLTIEFSREFEAVRCFHQLLCLTRKRHGVPPQPLNFFAQIQKHILAPGNGWVVLARHQGQPVAGAVYFHFNKNVLYKFGASDENHQHLRANNLVMAKAIEWYAQNNFSLFDFGRTSLHNKGLQQFKLGWGSSERQVSYVRLNPQTGGFLSAPDKADGFAQHVFNHLPLPVSRLIGMMLYRHVA